MADQSLQDYINQGVQQRLQDAGFSSEQAAEILSPGWGTRVRDELRQEYNQRNQNQPAPQTPAQAQQTQGNADKTQAEAAQVQALNAERQKNQQSGLGYVTNAEAAQLGLASKRADISQQNADLAQQRAQWEHDKAQDAAKAQDLLDQVRQGQLAVSQAREQWLEYKGQQDVANAQAKADDTRRHNLATEAETQRANQATATNNLLGQEVSQANQRASDATSIFNSTGNLALDVAKGGGTAAQIGNVLSGMLGVAPDFQASMGGASIPVTPEHLQMIRNLAMSGLVPPDANGNVVPNATKIVGAAVLPVQAPPVSMSSMPTQIVQPFGEGGPATLKPGQASGLQVVAPYGGGGPATLTPGQVSGFSFPAPSAADSGNGGLVDF